MTDQPEKTGSKLRPPIIAVLGHVDHGKTSLLDAIRKTSVQKKEAGGITQNIGASVITTLDGKDVTFIDTPGHAAFSNMRAQGANVADIAVLVVAADDGVKPQTKEALQFIREAKIPFVVAATKMDLASANIEKVYGDLEKEQVLFEGRGGDTPLVEVSAKTGEGLKELLEMITLVSEMHGFEGQADGKLEAVVIETRKDKRGPLASVVVRDGSISIGDEITDGEVVSKVRGLFDFQLKPIKTVYPGYPVQIIGFSELPLVGSLLVHKGDDIKAKLTNLTDDKNKAPEDGIPVVVKANNTSALEAVLVNIPEGFFVVSSGVGDVNQSDIFVAKSADADIYLFESKVTNSVKKLAENEGVSIHSYNIVYKLFEDLEEIIQKGKVREFGRAEILAEFPFDNKRVAGSKVISGTITKTSKVNIIRGDQVLGSVKILSIKKQKSDVGELKQGEEGGIIFVPQLEFKVGDVIVSTDR